MISRDGIIYDFTKSHYRHTLNGVTFVFSSQLHLDKFKDRFESNRKTINTSLSKRFNFSINVPTLADIVLYRKIETRGFLIEVKDEKVTCVNNITFDGGMANKKKHADN